MKVSALMKASRLHEGYLGPLVKAFPLLYRYPEALMKASRLHEGYLGPLVKTFPLHESSVKPTISPLGTHKLASSMGRSEHLEA